MAGRIIIYASSHGWGHNARLIPIIDQLWEYPIEVVSTAPEWFIKTSLKHWRKKPIIVRPIKTDPGCTQIDPFTINEEVSIKNWIDIWESKDKLLADELKYLRSGAPVRLIISDISYFGQLVAENLKVPSICIATFDWEFVYKNLLPKNEKLKQIITAVDEISKRFDYCLVPGTMCAPLCIGKQQISFHWLSRKPTIPSTEMRQKLNLNLYMDSVLLSFGGHTLNKIPSYIWSQYGNIQFFVLMGENEITKEPAENVHFLPNEKWSRMHTDLVRTVDCVFGKVGYGLCSEVTHCKKPFLNVASNWNPESKVLERFMETTVPMRTITEEQFLSGEWEPLLELIEAERDPDRYVDVQVDGEVQIAEWIRNLLGDKKPLDIRIPMWVYGLILVFISWIILQFGKKH